MNLSAHRMAAFATCSILALTAHGADRPWVAVLSESSANIGIPNFPATYTISGGGPALAKTGGGELGFLLTNAADKSGHWAVVDGVLRQFTAVNRAGALGPGRLGSEAAHVFFAFPGASNSTGSNNRIFVGQAGSPSQPPTAAPFGVWSFNGAANIEVARNGNVGALGPNLGAGWQFNITNANGFARVIPLAGGRVVMQAQVDSPSSAFIQGVVLHTPGSGNQGCAAVGLTGALAPGANLKFNRIDAIAANSDSVYMTAQTVDTAFNQASGIWRICEGAPVARALAKDTGIRGPGLAAGAFFNTLGEEIDPASGNTFFFNANGQYADAVAFDGIFHHDGMSNAPVVLRGVQELLGPRVTNFVFNQFGDLKTQAAGRFGVLKTRINNLVTGEVRFGLWRIARGAPAEPLAVVGEAGALAPLATRRWVEFQNEAILENGDVLTIADTEAVGGSDPRRSLWRIRPNRTPELLLDIGDRVTVNTTTGPQLVAITALEPVFEAGPLQQYGGDDSWVSADGSALIAVRLAGFGTTTFYLRGQATNVVTFADGFE